MEAYYFSEQPYPGAWESDIESLRVTLPNRHCDPHVAADLINARLDEWELCDRVGINIMINEHHSSATCLSPSNTITLAMLARRTTNVRLLGLGFPIANRPDPVRLAEEIAYIDCVTRGRLDIGFSKAAPYEISPANSNPARFMDRFWDTHDLVLKALTVQDGPFNWESEFHHFRQVNIWPRPYQQPRPPVWIPAGSIASAREVGQRGHTLAMFLSGLNARKLKDAYREGARAAGLPEPGPEKFAYMGIVAVGETREEGRSRADRIMGYLRTTSIVSDCFMNPPGYMPPAGNVMWMKRNQTRGRAGDHFPVTKRDGTILKVGSGRDWTGEIPMDDLIDANIVFAGDADDVHHQITEFSDRIGGIGTVLMMGHGGDLSHEDAMTSIRLFGERVLPRLKTYAPPDIAEAV
ncbi:MAG: LLM class flavin-dependent oxidoreductase [Rhodospirillaceae bacterium]|nr:LLM class flavin-dependent oxidoreductase [Rhodospirillaceae bacterium]MCY4067405.1 LLM class flavin-dependent oxidoreductase [Rhodospirillaceae bacterium]MDE0704892.1 LLM class flavin-dependent oxidoreductase [Rhodospirillaceae bacterium]